MDNSLIMEFNVSNQVLTRIDTRRVVEDSANYLYAHFNFSSDWDNIDKFIIVENKQLDLRFKVAIDAENKVKIPSSVIKHNGFSLMVVGQDENNYIVITTTTSMIQVLKTNYSDAEEEYIRTIISQTLTIIKEGNVASIEIPDVYFIDSNLTNDVLNFLNRNNEILQSIEMPYGKIHNISISINNTDYKLTLNAFDKDNNLLFSREADFDIESKAVSNFTYDSVNKTLILTLQNGGKFEVSIASLINGLQTEINENNKVSSAYIDDTNSANKFATLEQLNQIATNQNDIANMKDGTSLDSFADVEVALALKVDKANIGYVELSSSSGTLTDAQYAEAIKDYCIIKYANVDYYKAKTTSSSLLFYGINITVSGSTDTTLNVPLLTINTETKAFTASTNQIITTYNKSQANALLGAKQDTMSGSDSIDITSNTISVKETYITGQFLTDAEMTTLLGEVF